MKFITRFFLTHYTFFLCFALLAIACSSKHSHSRMDRKVDSLLSLMTIEEKIGQLNLPSAGYFKTGEAANSDIGKKIEQGKVGGLFNIKGVTNVREMQKIAVEKSRLKIPLLFGMDVIHGYETVFPIPLGLSCSWDMDLVQRSARMAATEASADGINWAYSPMVDIARDARWGRIAEGSGEDPYLGSRIAEAMVKGYQGNDLSANNTIMACVKHYALYGAAEAGRDYNTTDMSHLRMYNEYFPPYKAAIDAGVGSVMASFNEIDGIPATANKWLMTDVLRKQWGFNGLLVSDYTGVSEMVQHGIGDLLTVSARALDAGIDMDMVSEGFLTTLANSLKEGKITEQQINEACKRILQAKYKLGLLDDPYRYCHEERAKTEIFTAANRAFSRSVAAQSFVLLKNKNNLLPLKKQGTIALIGPLADAVENVTGTWSVAANFSQSITLKNGLEKATAGKAKILYAKGSNLYEDAYLEENATPFGKTLHRDKRSAGELRDEALRVAKQADVIVAALGESAEMTGEASSRSDISIPDTQTELLKSLLQTGKPVVLVLFNGRPMTLKWENENVPAILDVWFGGSEAGDAIADVLLGDVNPSGKLTTTFPQNIGQVPMYYAQKNTGRPMGKWFEKFRSGYLDVSNDPVYPFGFGLSYSQFEYSDIRLSKTEMTPSDSIIVSVDVANKSQRDGSEVVQLYLHDVVGSVTRPVKELKGFQKMMIKAGETKTVSFTLRNQDLSFYRYDLSLGSEPGKFEVFVGSDSYHVKQASFELK
ncbi:MAG: beta-glucosidase BglX [Bacteroidetes bacterium]|nr:beta-glucosidase BglX [Bacteroidota bacterium]MBS1539831.1 beta-glucosidase BglX [Bacteroidota bacterium]